MATYSSVEWPNEFAVMVARFDPELHGANSAARRGRCLWGDHDAPATWSAVCKGERWAVCDEHLLSLAAAELDHSNRNADRQMTVAERFHDYLIGDVEVLRRKGYNPTQYLAMVREHGAVGAAKRLLADPRHSSYGFQRLWEMGELERSVEFAVCLPWFMSLFTADEIDEAERRLVLHDFPLRERLAVREAHPPMWASS